VQSLPGKSQERERDGFSLELRYLLLANEAADGIAGLRPNTKPMLEPLGVEFDLRGFFQRIIRPYRFDDAPIAGACALDYDNAVEWLLLLSNPGQTNSQH
jgi:hypothetical protein